jgi:hypothetical protein
MDDDIEAFNAFEAAGWETRASDYDRFFRALTSRLVDPLLDAVGATAGMRLLDMDDYRHGEGFELPVSVKLAVGRRR